MILPLGRAIPVIAREDFMTSLFRRAAFVVSSLAVLLAAPFAAQAQETSQDVSQENWQQSPLLQSAPPVKPALRGLLSMGAYKFVSYPGQQPANTLKPIRAVPGIFGGIVLVASWQQLQPVKNGPLQSRVIDNFLAQIRVYNSHHPDKPLGVKLRIWGGFMAPDWAKSIGGAPIAATHNGKARTVGRFWSPPYRAAWRQLMTALAQKYDSEPLIREVAVTSCMSFTAEPFFVPTQGADGAGVLQALNAAQFSDGAYRFCLSNAVADYAAWQQTRIVLAVNRYRYKQGGSGDPGFTLKVMQACRAAIGVRCVFDNHDLNSPLGPSIAPIYGFIKNLGPEIEFQTLNTTPQNFGATIRLGVAYGASAIELYQDFGGFPPLSKALLRHWATLIEANTGEPQNSDAQ
jgi:hypothetical protein